MLNANPFLFPLENISYSLFWRFPACILILLFLKKPLLFRPKKDLITAALCLPVLCLTGFLVSLAAAFSGFAPPDESSSFIILAPEGIFQWIAVILLSFSTGTLEELYFRIYLPLWILELKQDTANLAEKPILPAFFNSACFLPALLFAFCHAYQGPWAFINALLAAFILSIAYIKSRSFAGIAIAHSLYNIFVFLMAALKP